MTTPESPGRIYLQPPCCADPDTGRLWCEDDAPVACEDGVPWTEYVRADGVRELAADLDNARRQRDGLRSLLGSVYRRLRDGREILPSQMEALRICYDRRRTLAELEAGGQLNALTLTGEDDA